jgi:hypothetical protein
MIEKYTNCAPLSLFFLSLVSLLTTDLMFARLTTRSRIDPIPVFHTRDPHLFLLDKEKEYYSGGDNEPFIRDRACISISVFGQGADRGKRNNGVDFEEPNPMDVEVPLGDITGRTAMIPLLFGATPQGTTLATVSPTLAAAKLVLFPGIGVIDDSTFIDPLRQLGYFSFDMRYRKYGVRFLAEARISNDFGINFCTGICSIKQALENITDQGKLNNTTFDPSATVTPAAVETELMETLGDILREEGLFITKIYPETSIEEIRLGLFWRHAYELNLEDESWPHVLLIPFVEATGSASPGAGVSPNLIFGVPFGNNQHSAVGFCAGLDFDFLETVSFTGVVGYTHFFSHSFDKVHVPTSEFQNNIYPFATDVNVRPGTNWHFTGTMAAHHFLHRLSMYFEYCMVEHKEDEITLKTPDPAFMPKVLEKKTFWKTKKINIGFTYDISPNSSLGFVWQAPLSERGTYKSSTVLFSFNALL